jgi:hypothetical protein
MPADPNKRSAPPTISRPAQIERAVKAEQIQTMISVPPSKSRPAIE